MATILLTIAKVKQRSKRSVIGSVIKNLLSQPPVIKIIAQSLSQHGEKLVPTSLSGIRVGKCMKRNTHSRLNPFTASEMIHRIIYDILNTQYHKRYRAVNGLNAACPNYLLQRILHQ
jgi:hypothetical protein